MTYEKTKISQEDIDQMPDGVVKENAEKTNRIIDEHNKQGVENIEVKKDETPAEKPEESDKKPDVPEKKPEDTVPEIVEDENAELAKLKKDFAKLEQQHKSLQGMWRDKDIVTALKTENAALKEAAQTQTTHVEKKEPTPITVEGIPQNLLDKLSESGIEQTDVEALVEAVFHKLQPQAAEQAARLEKVEEKTNQTAEQTAVSQADTLKLQMDSYIPGWRELEKHEKFSEYIHNYLPHTEVELQKVLSNAFYKSDLDAMKGIYDEFRQLIDNDPPEATPEVPGKPAFPKPVIEPDRGKAPKPNLKGKPMYKKSELAALYKKSGEWQKSTDPAVVAKGEALYKDLGLAPSEGRLT